MEIKDKVEVFSVEYICDSCGEGKMKAMGQMIMEEDFALFPHECDKCTNIQNLDIYYPAIVHEVRGVRIDDISSMLT